MNLGCGGFGDRVLYEWVGVERKSSRSSLEGKFDQHLTSHAQQLHLWK